MPMQFLNESLALTGVCDHGIHSLWPLPLDHESEYRCFFDYNDHIDFIQVGIVRVLPIITTSIPSGVIKLFSVSRILENDIA